MTQTCNLSKGIKRLVFSAPVPSHLKSLDHSMVESPNLTMVRVPCLKVAFWSTGSKMASRLSSTFSRRTGVPNWMQFSKSRMYGMFKRRACIKIMQHAPTKVRTSRCSRVNIQWVAIHSEILSRLKTFTNPPESKAFKKQFWMIRSTLRMKPWSNSARYLDVWVALLCPFVGLHLRINHQWPSPRVVQNDGVVNGQGIIWQVVDDPLADLHFITNTLPWIWDTKGFKMHLLKVLTKLVAHLHATYVPLKRWASVVNCKLNLVFMYIYVYIIYWYAMLQIIYVLIMELRSKHIKTMKTKWDSKSNSIDTYIVKQHQTTLPKVRQAELLACRDFQVR